MSKAHYEWFPDDHIAIIHCPPIMDAHFFAEARQFVIALGANTVDVVIDDERVKEMPPNFIEDASTRGVLAYPQVQRVAFCNIPAGWNLTLEAANKLATGNTDRVSFHQDVATAVAYLKDLHQSSPKAVQRLPPVETKTSGSV
jgi:hypothetical protein